MSEVKKDEVVDETVDEVIVEDTQVEATELDIPEAPLTAARTVSAIKASLAEMSKEGLDEIFEAAEKAKAKAKTEDDDEEDEDEDDEEEVDETVDGEGDLKGGKTAATKLKATPGNTKKKKKTDDGNEVEGIPEKAKAKKESKFKEDVDALVKDEDTLSEGFKEKAATIFEAALTSKVNAETAKLEEQYSSDLAGEVEAIKEDLVDKVDGYLTYVVENWMKDNEVAIKSSLIASTSPDKSEAYCSSNFAVSAFTFDANAVSKIVAAFSLKPSDNVSSSLIRASTSSLNLLSFFCFFSGIPSTLLPSSVVFFFFVFNGVALSFAAAVLPPLRSPSPSTVSSTSSSSSSSSSSESSSTLALAFAFSAASNISSSPSLDISAKEA